MGHYTCSAGSLRGLPSWIDAARKTLEHSGDFVIAAHSVEDLPALKATLGQAAHVAIDPRAVDWQRLQSFQSVWACKTELTSQRNIVVKVDDAMLAPHVPASKAPVGDTARRPRLYVDVQHGLGNRMRAYGSAAAIAKQTGRDLVLVWTPDNHCECRFSDLFDASDVEVIESTDQLPTKNLRRYTYMELEPSAMKDQPIDLDTTEDVLVRSAYVLNHPASNWDRENVEIRALKPAQRVADLVASVDLRDCIGAHVRMEAGKGLDYNSYDSKNNWSIESHDQIQYWRSKSHYSVFIKRIDNIFATSPNSRLFLATDLAENYMLFSEIYRDRLVYLPRDRFDRSRAQIIFALADALLLSMCSILLGSTWSSFSELALRFATKNIIFESSGRDF